jgi:putative Holliday junction resolvase
VGVSNQFDGDATNLPGRVLALDLGKRRIGVAISDPLGLTAQGLPTLERTTIREDIAALADLARSSDVMLFLVGKPLHMSGAESRQAAWTDDFARRLTAASGIPVEFRDERLTTVEAQRVLRSSGISIEKRNRAVDRLAAVILLQSWLDAHDHAS